MVPFTPAAARKLQYAQMIMKIDLDERVHEMAEAGRVDVGDIADNVPGLLPELLVNGDEVNTTVIDFCQYAADHDTRFVMGARDIRKAYAYSLLAALAQGDQVLIVGLFDGTYSDAWRSLLAYYKVEYEHVKDADDAFDSTTRVLLVEEGALTHAILKDQRHRVCIFVNKIGAPSIDNPSFDDLLKVHGQVYSGPLAWIAKEFPKTIAAFVVEQDTVWWQSIVATSMIQSFYPRLNAGRTFTDSPHQLQALTDMGFTYTEPDAVARFMGINTDFL